MVGISEEDLNAEVVSEVALGKAFHSGLGADGHEDGRLNGAVGRVEETSPGTGVRALGD